MTGIKEFKNPIYSRLCEQLLLEHSIHRERKSGLDFSITLVCDHLFGREDLAQHLKLSRDQDAKVTIANIVHTSILVTLDKRHQVGLFSDSFLRSNILDKIIAISTSQSFPSSSKSLVIFFLKEISLFQEACSSISGKLSLLVKSQLDERNYSVVPDLIFGCLDRDILSNNDVQALAGDAIFWTREKIAKMVLYLISNGMQDDAMSFVKILENKIEEEFNSWIEPDIWLSIIESEKLINSNLPIDEVRLLLQNLKRTNVAWSKVIEGIETDGIFIRLNSFQGKAVFSSTEDSLSVLALKKAQRQTVFQINSEDAQLFEKLSEPGKKISSKGVGNFVLLNIVLSMSVAWVLLNVKLIEFTAMFGQSLSPDSIWDFLSLIIKKPIVLLLLIFWNVNAWRALIANQNFSLWDIVWSIPLFGKKLKEFFNNPKV